MTDRLRDCIAKAIYLEANNWGGPNWETISPKVKPAYLALADAVIEALGLKHYCRDCGGWGTFDE